MDELQPQPGVLQFRGLALSLLHCHRYVFACQHWAPLNTDRWSFRVFQSAPDLGHGPTDPGDRLYRFEALELKELSHRLDGVLWPRVSTGCAETGSAEFPVVLLEVQMHPDPGFHHRLAAQSLRFLQRHPQVEHLEVVVITPHQRLTLGPTRQPRLLQVLLQEVHWINLGFPS